MSALQALRPASRTELVHVFADGDESTWLTLLAVRTERGLSVVVDARSRFYARVSAGGRAVLVAFVGTSVFDIPCAARVLVEAEGSATVLLVPGGGSGGEEHAAFPGALPRTWERTVADSEPSSTSTRSSGASPKPNAYGQSAVPFGGRRSSRRTVSL